MFDNDRLLSKKLKQDWLGVVGKALSERTLIGSLGLSAKKANALAKANNGFDFSYVQIRLTPGLIHS